MCYVAAIVNTMARVGKIAQIPNLPPNPPPATHLLENLERSVRPRKCPRGNPPLVDVFEAVKWLDFNH